MVRSLRRALYSGLSAAAVLAAGALALPAHAQNSAGVASAASSGGSVPQPPAPTPIPPVPGAPMAAAGVAPLPSTEPGGSLMGGTANKGEFAQPILLEADTVENDNQRQVVTARGNVELSQGQRVILADEIVYNKASGVVEANGNVRLLEPSGDVVFAQHAELTDDMKQGFVDSIRILMTDNARVAGEEGERVDGRYTRVERGVYSPCDLCQDDPTKAPLWQVKAVRVVHDSESKDVIYNHATMELFGVPVFYTPYFSHPDPTVERRSGLLAPRIGSDSELGQLFSTQYYLDLAPDLDATLGTILSTKDGAQLSAEVRKRFENGTAHLDMSGVNARRTEGRDTADETDDRSLRGHIFASTEFDLDRNWRIGGDLNRTSDDDYLRRYGISDADILTSRAYGEYFSGRDYGTVSTYDFQDLRPSVLDDEPLVLPLASYSMLGEPGQTWGGRWSMDVDAVAVSRDKDDEDDLTGQIRGDSRRTGLKMGWQRDLVDDSGLVTTVDTSLRGDVFSFTDFSASDDPTVDGDDHSYGRLFPQAQVTARYPLVRSGESSQTILEPTVQLTAAPVMHDDDHIRNEDSRGFEFDTLNLFRSNRFAGVDRLDSGSRASYGVRGSLFDFGTPGPGAFDLSGGSLDGFLGQSYRFSTGGDNFDGSGVDDRFSDIVGSLDLRPNGWMDLSYSFALDNDSFNADRHEVTASAGQPVFRPRVSYLFLDNNFGTTVDGETEELTVGASSQLTRYWSTYAGHSWDLANEGGSLNTQINLTYADECFSFITTAQREYTEREDVDSGYGVFFQLVFKNLGEVTSPTFRTGAGSDSSR